MARSLNPHAAGQSTPVVTTPPQTPDRDRRGFVAGAAALVVGAIVSIVPLGAGLAFFLDPLFKRKRAELKSGESARPLRRVATVEALPADGTPVQVPVIADQSDAWNREANQPVGAVYLRRVGSAVECFNAICPHAGCFVAYAADRKVFQCPCHTSSFQLDGTRIMPSPSPRNMDSLRVDEQKLADGEVWVEFVNYFPGHEEREPKP